MNDEQHIWKVAKNIGKNQMRVLKSLQLTSQSLRQLNSIKSAVFSLKERGLIELKDEQFFLSNLGQAVCHYWQKQSDENNQKTELEKPQKNNSPKHNELRQAKLEKSNEFLDLYSQGLSYQDIGDQYGLSRERVRQILSANPSFHAYLKEREESEVIAEQNKKKRIKQEFYSKTLAALYPERVAELWDYERNGDLKPEDVSAGTTQQYVWFKCPIDEHSWKKKPNDITTSWVRSGTSGCPMCVGRKKQAEKQPALTRVYPELIKEFWDYKKNDELNLDPEKLTLASNKKAWFKCPHDGNEWQSSIVSTINQQWTKGNAGCRVCNGTAERNFGGWKRRESIAVEFPSETEKYWFYEANNELGLDPKKLTSGSSKEAFFKCPTDGHEWVSPITSVARSSWARGNSGCPACRGLVATMTTSLAALYPDYVAQYWDYQKNNELKISPQKVTRGSQREAWFKCPIDGYEWNTNITTLTKASWDRGNSGCARCGSGWTLEAIRQFVASLEVHVPNLTQAELYKIFEQSSVLDTQNAEGLKFVKDVIKGKLTGQKLRDVIQGKKVSPSEIDSDVDDLKADNELHTVDGVQPLSRSDGTQVLETNDAFAEALSESNSLPKVKVQQSLEFLNSKVIASADQEAIDFFVASRRNRIWAEVFEDESAVEALEAFTEEGYGHQVRDQFLDEYNQARDMPIPSGWAFRVDGKITPPNLMQKLAAVRLRSQQRMLNLSLTGTGKTIGGILSSRIIDAHLTIIICPLDTVQNWHGEIKHVFPDSRVTTKNFNPDWVAIQEGHHYLLLNHEMFQQPLTASHIRQLLDRYQIDLVIVDEIHRCKQRGYEPSKRRQMVLALITNASEKNPDLHVLGMSATPVINNLKEGKSLVELVTGIERPDLGERATLNNCMQLHQAFVTLGIRALLNGNMIH